jgi:hypothetical protein
MKKFISYIFMGLLPALDIVSAAPRNHHQKGKNSNHKSKPVSRKIYHSPKNKSASNHKFRFNGEHNLNGLLHESDIKWLHAQNLCNKNGHYNPQASRKDFNNAFVAFFKRVCTQQHMPSDVLDWISSANPDINSKDCHGHSAWYYTTKAKGKPGQYGWYNLLQRYKLDLELEHGAPFHHKKTHK